MQKLHRLKNKWKYCLVILLLAGCAQTTHTRATSYIDPDYRGGTYSSFIIDYQGNSLAERTAIERTAALQLRNAGLQAQAGMDVVPPTRNVGEQALKGAFMNTGAASVIEIMPKEKYIDREYIPGNRFRPRSFGHNRGYYYEPYYDPGIVLEEPHARYDVRLSILPKYKTVWTGEFETTGPTGMDFTEVGAHFAEELVERLGKDGLIILPPR